MPGRWLSTTSLRGNTRQKRAASGCEDAVCFCLSLRRTGEERAKTMRRGRTKGEPASEKAGEYYLPGYGEREAR